MDVPDSLKRGYFGIGIFHGKTSENLGVLWRSAQNFGASYIFTIQRRYKKQASDTMKAAASIPYFHYEDFTDFYNHLPKGALLVGVELTDKAVELKDFKHSRNAVYLLGAEDHGLPSDVQEKCHLLIKFRSPHSLNVSVAGSIVLYDRSVKGHLSYVGDLMDN